MLWKQTGDIIIPVLAFLNLNNSMGVLLWRRLTLSAY